MNKLTTNNKSAGQPLSHSEWNEAVNKINELVESANSGGGSGGEPIDTSGVITVSSKGNVQISSGKNINLEPAEGPSNYGDIALKPGDDIQFCSHHREPKKRDKVVVKNIDGSDNPVKLQVVAGEIDLALGTENNPKTATKKKDKTTGNDTNESLFKYDERDVLDVRILTGNVLDKNEENERDERGYLKVRAQAIDLRCEKHGGIALQPKGYDSQGNMNKIKFEHGGGDGLEFGTFNTEKSSLYTDEYRFKKDGVWKMATRQTTANTKKIIDEGTIPSGKEATAARKFVKQADDFYDIIDPDDEQATTEEIIRTAYTLNGAQGVKTHITSKGNLEIETSNREEFIQENATSVPADATVEELVTLVNGVPTTRPVPGASYETADAKKYYSTVGSAYTRIIAKESPNINIETDSAIKLSAMHACVWDDVAVTAENFSEYASQMGTGLKAGTEPAAEYVDGKIYGITNDDRKKSDIDMTAFDSNLRYVRCRQISESGGISLESDAKIKISAPKLTLEGVTGFGSSMTFGEADEGIKYQYKATKKGNNKQCDIVQVEVLNNGTTDITFNHESHSPSNYEPFGGQAGEEIPTFCLEGDVTVPAQQKVVIAQASMFDIIKLVNWMKSNEQGPWQPTL